MEDTLKTTLFIPVLNELEVQGEHGEIAAAGAPRGVVGGEVFFLQRCANDFDFGGGAHGNLIFF